MKNYSYFEILKRQYQNTYGHHYINLGFGNCLIYDNDTCKWYLINEYDKSVSNGLTGIEIMLLFTKRG